MTQSIYRDKLFPWAIYRWLPSGKSYCIGRYRNRQEAENHLKIARLEYPSRQKIVFDLPQSEHDAHEFPSSCNHYNKEK